MPPKRGRPATTDHVLSIRLPADLAKRLKTRDRERPGVWARDVLAASIDVAWRGDAAELCRLHGVSPSGLPLYLMRARAEAAEAYLAAVASEIADVRRDIEEQIARGNRDPTLALTCARLRTLVDDANPEVDP